MTTVLGLLRALALRRWLLLVRYPVDTIGQLVTVVVLFALVFLGGRAIIGPSLGGSLSGIVVGYFLWSMAVGAYSSLATTITAETRWGTLEQLLVVPRGFETIALLMAIVSIAETFLWGGFVLLVMLVITGVDLHVSVPTVLVVGGLALCTAAGVGLAVGGLAVVYKRVGSLVGLLQFAFVGFVAAPVAARPTLHGLPMATGTFLLRRSMTAGMHLAELSPTLLGGLALKAAAYLTVGLVVIRRAVDVARRRGATGDY